MTYTTKNIDVEAIQFNGNNSFDIWAFMNLAHIANNLELKSTDHPVISMSETDKRTMDVGDWLVKSGPGYFLVSDKAFKSTFEVRK